MNAIHLVTATDDHYARPLAVMLTSIFENKKSSNPISVYIINGGISGGNLKLFSEIEKNYRTTIQFLSINQSLFNGLTNELWKSKAIYYRIIIPDLLDKDIDKVIYLDSDCIIRGDITELWNTDISNHALAAVEDYVLVNRTNEISIPKEFSYFNSGVLVINVKKWRMRKAVKKIYDYIIKNPDNMFPDQDALNVMFYNDWLKLDPKWNVGTFFYHDQDLSTHRTIVEARETACIYHCTAYPKPWEVDYYFKTPFKEEYVKYHSIFQRLCDGMLMKGTRKAVYLVENGEKHHIPSREMFEGLGFKWEDIHIVSDETLHLIPDGSKFQHEKIKRKK